MRIYQEIYLNETYFKSRIFLIIFLLGVCVFSAHSQNTNDYRSAGTGNWNTLATWQRWNGSSWATPTSGQGVPSSSAKVITIRANHSVTLDVNKTIDQLVVASNGTLIINSSKTLTVNNGTGTDVKNNGTIINNGTISNDYTITNNGLITNNGTISNAGTITNNATFQNAASSIYNHNQNGGVIPNVSWNSNSNCYINNITNTAPTGLNQTFGNFIWNSSSQTGTISLGGNLTDIEGDFTIQNTNGKTLRLFSATNTLTVRGNFNIVNGTLDISNGAGTSTINVNGNVTLTGGTITETGSSEVNFNFSGTTLQTYSKLSTTISNTINFAILSNAKVSFGTSKIDGSSGSFIANASSTIKTANVQGISITGATGSIQVTGTRTYSSGVNYIYNGTIDQITGVGLNQNQPASLTIDNPTTVSLSAYTIINGNILISQGTFVANGFALSINGTWTNNGSFSPGTSIVHFIGTYDSYIIGTASTNFYNLDITKSLSSVKLISNSKAFVVSNYLQVIQGTLDLQAIDANYYIGGNFIVDATGIVSHNVDWDSSGKLLQIGGNLQVDGMWNYSVSRSHVQMIGNNKTLKTGNSPSALSILTLQSGKISANGLVTINDNFWAMFGTASGSFHTNGYDVYANAALLNDGGTIYIDGGTLNVIGGISIGGGNQNGSFEISNGTLNADNITVGSETHAGTIIQLNSSIVNLSGIQTILNGSFSISGGTYTTAGLEIGNGVNPSTLNQSGGTINVTSSQLKINSGSSYICSNSPTIKVNRDFYNDGTFTPATSTVILEGSVNQKIKGVPTTFTNITIANIFGDITIETPINIQGNLTLTSGIVMTSSINVITLKNGATTTIGSPICYIDGPLHFEKSSIGVSTFYLPLGKSIDYRPVELTVNHSTTTSYTYKTELFNNSAGAKGWTLPTGIDNVSKVHYWSIHRFASNDLNTQVPVTDLVGNQIITLYYNANDGVEDATHLSICKGTAASTTWINIGGIGATNNSGKISSTSNPSTFTSFSDFTLGNTSGGINELPIQLSAFDAFVTPQDIQFSWVTKSEINNDFYTLSYSIDGKEFIDITAIEGNGTTSNESIYEYAYKNYSLEGIVYFRLQQTDYNGNFTYSPIISIHLPNKNVDVFIFPNPAVDFITIQDNSQTIQNIQFFDQIQNEIHLPKVDLSTYSLKNIPTGVYFVKITTDSKCFVKTFVKQ